MFRYPLVEGGYLDHSLQVAFARVAPKSWPSSSKSSMVGPSIAALGSGQLAAATLYSAAGSSPARKRDQNSWNSPGSASRIREHCAAGPAPIAPLKRPSREALLVGVGSYPIPVAGLGGDQRQSTGQQRRGTVTLPLEQLNPMGKKRRKLEPTEWRSGAQRRYPRAVGAVPSLRSSAALCSFAWANRSADGSSGRFALDAPKALRNIRNARLERGSVDVRSKPYARIDRFMPRRSCCWTKPLP